MRIGGRRNGRNRELWDRLVVELIDTAERNDQRGALDVVERLGHVGEAGGGDPYELLLRLAAHARNVARLQPGDVDIVGPNPEALRRVPEGAAGLRLAAAALNLDVDTVRAWPLSAGGGVAVAQAVWHAWAVIAGVVRGLNTHPEFPFCTNGRVGFVRGGRTGADR